MSKCARRFSPRAGVDATTSSREQCQVVYASCSDGARERRNQDR